MTTDQFAEMAYRVIAKDGIAGHLPSAAFPGRREVTVLEGMPNDVDPETEAVACAAARAEHCEELLVASKIDEARLQGRSKVSECIRGCSVSGARSPARPWSRESPQRPLRIKVKDDLPHTDESTRP